MTFCRRQLQLVILSCLLVTVDSNTYCSGWQYTSTTTGQVHFTDKPGPATLAIACVDQQVDLICCTAEFTRIDWFVWDKHTESWLNFDDLDPDKRGASKETNQVVSLVKPTADDATNYKCIAYGQTSADSINNVVELRVRNCTEWHKRPERLLPYHSESTVEVDPGENVSVPCSGYYGNLKACSAECNIGWYRNQSSMELDIIDENTTERIHRVTLNMNGNTIRSTLHIINVTEDDYGLYQCWMVNSYGFTEPSILVSLQHKQPPIAVVDATFKISLIVLCCFVAVVVTIMSISCSNRQNFQLFNKQRQRTPPDTEGLLYDVVLLHAQSSTVSKSLGEYLYNKLTTGGNFKPYSVYYVNNDVMPNQSIFSALNGVVLSTRCVVVVICPTFIQEPQCRHHLLHILPLCHVVYVLHAGIKSSTDAIVTSQLEESVQASMRNSGRTVVWTTMEEESAIGTCQPDGEHRLSSVEEAGKLIDPASSSDPSSSGSPGLEEVESGKRNGVERQPKRQVEKFWRELLLAIPNKRLQSVNNAAADQVMQLSTS